MKYTCVMVWLFSSSFPVLFCRSYPYVVRCGVFFLSLSSSYIFFLHTPVCSLVFVYLSCFSFISSCLFLVLHPTSFPRPCARLTFYLLFACVLCFILFSLFVPSSFYPDLHYFKFSFSSLKRAFKIGRAHV